MDVLRNVVRFPTDRPYLATLVKVVGLKVGRSRRTGRVTFLARTSSPELYANRWSIRKYTTEIAFHDDKNVHLSCSCPDFMFRHEYALWYHGAADILFGNGEPPNETNPRWSDRKYAATCKHCIMLTSVLVDKGYLTPTFTLSKKSGGGAK